MAALYFWLRDGAFLCRRFFRHGEQLLTNLVHSLNLFFMLCSFISGVIFFCEIIRDSVLKFADAHAGRLFTRLKTYALFIDVPPGKNEREDSPVMKG